MDSRRPHERLEVWKRSIDLTVSVYKLTEGFPSAERYGLVSQMRRASVSVGSNIAEGAGRGTTGYYLYHLGVAQGSLAELDTQLVISSRLGFISGEDYETITKATLIIGKMLSSLTKSLRAKGVKEDPIPYSPFPIP